MLQPIEIDDKTYAELMADSFEVLPKLAPEWTDYNAHDPGITLLEMITWLTEMQRYHTAQITDAHRLRYLRLLGAAPRAAQPAELLVRLAIAGDSVDIPPSAMAWVGDIPYRPRQGETLSGAQIEVSEEWEGRYRTPRDLQPFGDTPAVGDCLYLRLSCPLPLDRTVSLYLQVGEDPLPGAAAGAYEPPAEIVVEVYDGSGWFDCMLQDGTCGLAQSGYIRLRSDKPMPNHLLRVRLTRWDAATPTTVAWMSFQVLTLIQRGPEQETRGLAGRVREGLTFSLETPTEAIEATNPFCSHGGQNAESIDEALARVLRDSAVPTRAVSAGDYRALVATTPFLDVRSVNAFTSAPGQVCVCVHTGAGRLTEREIRNLRRRLYPCKPACIQLEIRQPVYWEARLYADIILSDWAHEKTLNLKVMLAELYRPLESQFEAVISLSDWSMALQRHHFVREVRALTLRHPNDRAYGMESDFVLPPDRLLRVIETIITVGYG